MSKSHIIRNLQKQMAESILRSLAVSHFFSSKIKEKNHYWLFWQHDNKKPSQWARILHDVIWNVVSILYMNDTPQIHLTVLMKSCKL